MERVGNFCRTRVSRRLRDGALFKRRMQSGKNDVHCLREMFVMSPIDTGFDLEFRTPRTKCKSFTAFNGFALNILGAERRIQVYKHCLLLIFAG